MKEIGKITFVIIGSIIGAGFASGKEIDLFFAQYGALGILGIVVAIIFMGVILQKVLSISYLRNIESYETFINKIAGNSNLGNIISKIINVFLVLSFYIMVAGFSAYFSQELSIPSSIGAVLISIGCYIIFLGNINRIMKVNSLLIPLLIIFILVMIRTNLDAFQNLNSQLVTKSPFLCIINAILYGSYNTVLLIPILIPLAKQIKNKKQIAKITVISSFILGILALSIYGLIIKINCDITNLDLPMVYFAGMMGKGYQICYGVIILVSIFTSAISAGYGLLQNYTKQPRKYKLFAILLCITSLFVCHIGFSTLVSLLYPILGVLGLIQIGMLFRTPKGK